MTTMRRTERDSGRTDDSGQAKLKGASPAAAAAFAAGIVYVWAEALFRLLFTYYPSFNARWQLWNGRVGDVAAMWLTISVAAAVAGLGLYWAWRRKPHVGAIADWTILLIASAIAGPMIGEIGQGAGSPSTGTGSTTAVTVIAYAILGAVVIGTVALLGRIHMRR